MDEASSSSSTQTKSEGKQLKTTAGGGLFSLINDDLLHNILARLPALSFASAACVSKSWSQICSRILSRPKFASALSLHPSLAVAWEEVTEKVLAEPIRPHFIIANVGSGFRLFDIRKLILNKFDALTRAIIEVKWDGVSGDVSDEDCSIPAEDGNYGIVLTVGFVPGLKVDAIPAVINKCKDVGTWDIQFSFVHCQFLEPREVFINKFLMDIKDYTASISDCTAPVGIIMFGDGCTNMRPVVNALDYALPKETVIVGDEKGRFLYRSENESRNVCGSAKYFSVLFALIFARDKDNCGIGDIQFQIALSEGVATVGPRYKAVSVRASTSDSTWLTARREGHPEILDGQRILNDINDELENHADSSDLYIGVIKRRSISTGSEKHKLVTSLDFHGVIGSPYCVILMYEYLSALDH
ncbi:hypothetical protein M0R45_023834 [Rubus argutus]|uniref:F-box domain-containing protein n=1 Tax=Rubus argutus TaxID=59490 RepID=A0AAW1WPR8_RUBAR